MLPKIQLIRCPIDDLTIAADQWNMPLDLLTVADAIDRRCEVEVIDGTLLGLEGVIGRIDPNAECIGLTYTALSAKSLKTLLPLCKSNGAFVLLGGQPATAAARSLILEENIDAICVGDGQPTMSVLSQQIANGSIDLKVIPNLLLRDNGDIIETDRRSDDVWNQRIPRRDFGGLEPKRYLSFYPDTNTLLNIGGENATNIFSKRGCRRQCSFCARQDKQQRFRSPALVANEIRCLADTYDIDYILDTSDTWVDFDWGTEFSREREKAGIEHIGMMVFADVRDITAEVSQMLVSCGVDSVLFGVESGSERILRRNGKNMTRQQIIDAVDRLVYNDIKVSCSFVLGLLDEDEDSLAETIGLTRELNQRAGVLCYGNTIMPLMGSWLWKSAFPSDRNWPSFITRALDYDLQSTRELYVSVATNVMGGVKTLQSACEEILNSCDLPQKEYAR